MNSAPLINDYIATEDIDTSWVIKTFKDGTGWQRRLAGKLGIAESTMSNYVRNDCFPRYVCYTLAYLTVYEGCFALHETYEDSDKFTIVKTVAGYSIAKYESGDEVGEIIATVKTKGDAVSVTERLNWSYSKLSR